MQSQLQSDHIKILKDVLQESCQGEKIVSRTVLFERFEEIANSGIELYIFKKSLSYLINNHIIVGYCIKAGYNGGVYRDVKPEKITVTCSSGEFTGYVSKKELSRLISSLVKSGENNKNGKFNNRSRSQNENPSYQSS